MVVDKCFLIARALPDELDRKVVKFVIPEYFLVRLLILKINTHNYI